MCTRRDGIPGAIYATPAEIQAEITARQTAVFGEVMRLNLTAAPGSAAVQLLPPGQTAGTAQPPPLSGRFTDDDDEGGAA